MLAWRAIPGASALQGVASPDETRLNRARTYRELRNVDCMVAIPPEHGGKALVIAVEVRIDAGNPANSAGKISVGGRPLGCTAKRPSDFLTSLDAKARQVRRTQVHHQTR